MKQNQHDDNQGTAARATLFDLDRRHFLGLLGGGAATALAGTGVFSRRALAAAGQGGVLRAAAPANPSSLDPMTGVSGGDHVTLFTMYDTLVEWEYATLKARPGLAESWSFSDPQTLVLNLRKGVVFHDGTPFDAEAVKFNLERNRGDKRSTIKADLASVDSVTVTGPLQVTLKLKAPNSALVLILSDRAGMMVSPKAVQAGGEGYARAPVGTGPWKLISWADNSKIVLARNDKYWKPGLPHVDGIEFSIIPEMNTGLRSVIAGENDMAFRLSPQQKPVIDRAKALKAVTGPTLFVHMIYFNYSRKPLNDVRVRQAINYAIDREAFNKATMRGLGEPAMMALPKSHWAFDQELANFYPHDPAKARKLLQEAGYGNGLDFQILAWSDQTAQQRQEVLIDQLGKAGIRLKVKLGSIADTSSQFFGPEKAADGMLSAWTGRPDPSLTYLLMFSKDGFYNAGRVDVVPGLVEAQIKTQASADPEERKQAFAKLQRLVVENALFCPLVFDPEIDALSTKVGGYQPNLLGKPKFEEVSLQA